MKLNKIQPKTAMELDFRFDICVEFVRCGIFSFCLTFGIPFIFNNRITVIKIAKMSIYVWNVSNFACKFSAVKLPNDSNHHKCKDRFNFRGCTEHWTQCVCDHRAA